MMPVDSMGNRAEVIADPMATGSRMNYGRNYEAYIGATLRDNRTRLIERLRAKYGDSFIERLTESDVEEATLFLRGLYALINEEMVEFIDGLNSQERYEHLIEILNDNLYIYYPTDNGYNIIDIVDNIENSVYKPHFSPVILKDEYGNINVTKDNVRIGVLYFMLLEKIGNTYSSVSSAYVNTFGFPVKPTGNDKNRYPHSLTPSKILGETEVRIFASYLNPVALADLIDINTNPNSHKYIVKHILESEKAFDDSFNVDREVVPYGQHKSLMLLRHLFQASGFDIAYVKHPVENPFPELKEEDPFE